MDFLILKVMVSLCWTFPEIEIFTIRHKIFTTIQMMASHCSCLVAGERPGRVPLLPRGGGEGVVRGQSADPGGGEDQGGR